MNVFDLFAKITLDSSDYEKGLDQASAKGSKFAENLKKGFSVAAKVTGAALTAGAVAFTSLTTLASNKVGELEQNMGGSEAVFKENAESMQETAESAYKNMGLSASSFLATANKMGALMQGSGISISESADLSAKAMQRAADVASIMGIDVSAAMESVAGAAKGNFTMMDNLGVAMNATTIEAYALSKGIEQSYNEMDNATKVGLAMEMFLEKTTYAAGNYAKENQTLAGSLTTAKAAWDNFLSGAGGVDELVDSVVNAGGVIIDNLTQILPRLTTGIGNLIKKLVPKIPPMIEELLPAVVTGAVTIISGLAGSLPEMVGAITAILPNIVNAIFGELLPALLGAIPNLIDGLVTGIVAAVPALAAGVVTMITALAQHLPEIIQAIIDAIPVITDAVNQALMDNFPALLQGIIQLVLGIVENLPTLIQTLIDQIPMIVETVVTVLLSNLPAIIAGVAQIIWGILKALPSLLKSIWDSLFNWIGGLTQGVKNVAPQFREAAGQWISKLGDGLRQTWENIKSWARGIWDSVRNWFSGLWSSFVNIGSNIINGLWQGLQNAWQKVKNWFNNAISNLIGDTRRKLDTHSPSGVFEDIGEDTGEGFGIGWKNKFDKIRKSIMGDLDFVNSYTPKISGGIKTSNSRLINSSINLTINGARYSDENSLADAVASRLQNMIDRKERVYA